MKHHPAWRRPAVIGYGAITSELLRTLADQRAGPMPCGILVRPGQMDSARASCPPEIAVVDNLADLLALQPDCIAECAGHEALQQYGADILEAGIDLLVLSVGALTDPVFGPRLLAHTGPGRLYIASGAVAGIDGLLAARTAGLAEVTYTSVKGPTAWVGTPAGPVATEARERTVFFEGTAREAASLYPKNANVAATVALAGLGLDATRVKLVSDPAATAPLGVIEARGAFGTFHFEILAYAAPSNPKTSLLTAHSVIAAWRNGCCFTPPGQ